MITKDEAKQMLKTLNSKSKYESIYLCHVLERLRNYRNDRETVENMEELEEFGVTQGLLSFRLQDQSVFRGTDGYPINNNVRIELLNKYLETF